MNTKIPTCLQLPMQFRRLVETVQTPMQISWVGPDSHPQVLQWALQCPKDFPLSMSEEVQHLGKAGSCNLSLPNCRRKCSSPRVHKNHVQSSHYGKWLPALAPATTIREAFQYGFRLLQGPANLQKWGEPRPRARRQNEFTNRSWALSHCGT